MDIWSIARIKEAYKKRKKVIEARAAERRLAAKTRFEKERIKAVEKKELLDLERHMYEAITAAQQARVAMEKARRAAGVITMGERVSGFTHELVGAGRNFYKGLMAPQPSRRRVVKRKRE